MGGDMYCPSLGGDPRRKSVLWWSLIVAVPYDRHWVSLWQVGVVVLQCLAALGTWLSQWLLMVSPKKVSRSVLLDE